MDQATFPTIRRRDDGDLPACVAALRRVHEADGYPVNWPSDPRRFLTSGRRFGAWVAVDGETVSGHAVLSDAATERSELAGLGVLPTEPLAAVSRLFVTPTARGRGIAGRLLEVAARAAEQLGRGLTLSVVDDGRGTAIAVYEHLGWSLIATLPVESWTLPDGTKPRLRYYLAPR